MLTPLVAKPPRALYSAAGRLRTLKTNEVTTGPAPGAGWMGVLARTTKRVVLWASSSTSVARTSSA